MGSTVIDRKVGVVAPITAIKTRQGQQVQTFDRVVKLEEAFGDDVLHDKTTTNSLHTEAVTVISMMRPSQTRSMKSKQSRGHLCQSARRGHRQA